jgi:soluble lytic murein transglycosylase
MMFSKVLLLGCLLALLSVEASADSLQDKANAIRVAMDSRDFDRAEALVRELRKTDSAAYLRNNYDYLLARLVDRRGARTEATSLYLAILNRGSMLASYSLWHLANTARASGDLALERQYLTRLVARFPSNSLTRRARERITQSHFDSGDYRAGITMLRPFAGTAGTQGRTALAKLGEAYARVGDLASARTAFEQLVSGSRDDSALRAAQGLDALDRAANTSASEFEALRRARIYLTNRHWEEARAHLTQIIGRFPDSPNRSEAIYQTGFTFYRQDQFETAIKWFERAYAEFPGKKDGEQGYYYVGTALQKARRYDEAARRYMDFINVYPQSDLIEGAYRNVVDCLRYARNDQAAIEWSRRLMQRFAGRPLYAVGIFNEAKIEMTRGQFGAAEQLLMRLQAQPVYPRLVSAPIRGEASFLRAYTIELTGRLSEAARLYLAIPDERDNYFGYRATIRLRAMAKTDQGRSVIDPLARAYREQARAALAAGRHSEAKDAANQALRIISDSAAQRDLIEILRVCYAALPSYASVWNYRLIPLGRGVVLESDSEPTSGQGDPGSLAAELLFLGLYDEGAIELRLAGFGVALERSGERAGDAVTRPAGHSAGDVARHAAFSMAVYSNRGDHAQYAIRFAEPVFKSIPQDFRLELMARDLIELLYPSPYKDWFDIYAPKLGVDPRLVLSLARQESRFDPNVKSPQAARGLLQFITETALDTARDEGMESFELDDVYEPGIAVRLAVRHVSDLFKQFPGNPYAVIASYNTGAANVERWIFRSLSSDVDRLVAEIAIPETKDYVAKVMNNYRAYQQLYSVDLKSLR